MATKFKQYVQNLYVAESSAMVLKGVDDYLKIAREKIKRHPQFANLYRDQRRDVATSVGGKYIKIWDTERGQKRSIHAFIDKVTGDVLKAAGINAPAKGARGNVLDRKYMDSLNRVFDTHGGHLYSRHSLSYNFKRQNIFK